jgi:conjugal transfer/type IV secretion protein DotA/TraY
MLHPAVLIAVFLILPAAGPALAGPFDVSWQALDPGDDWSATMIRSVFPIDGNPPTETGNAATVVGQIIGQLTGFVSAIAMAFLSYVTIMNIHRVAESGQILTNAMSSLFLVRVGFAAVMMFPVGSGFSTGQAAVVQASMWGIGMAKNLYANAVKAIGPDAMVIAQPMIPGTKTIVYGLIQNEFCRALVNEATNTANSNKEVVPIPTPTQIAETKNPGFGMYDSGGKVTWAYSVSSGNETNSPTCGSITVEAPKPGNLKIAGIEVDMTSTQRAILEEVVLNDIRPSVEAVAAQFWARKKAESLAPLLGTYQAATQSYTEKLSAKATDLTNKLRNALQNSEEARAGNVGLIENQAKLSALGWTSAGAYYLEFARLNGQTLSLLSAVPTVNTPSFNGLSKSLKSDIAPLLTSLTAFMTKLSSHVQTLDGLHPPGGNAQLLTGEIPGGDGASTMEQILQALNLSQPVLDKIVYWMAPSGSNWTDPFGALIQLGHELINTSAIALGTAGLLASTTGTAGAVTWNILTLNWPAAAAAGGFHLIMQFLGTPVLIGITALLIPGLTIAFILPMIPWVMWIAGVAGYLILVCEAVIAVPLWMLAHMTFEGAGLHGRATAGYALIFNVLFRPVLMLIGLFLGYFVFTATSWLIRASFGIAAGFVLGNGWLVSNWLGLFVLLSIFTMTHVISAMMSFRMIALLPHHLPHLIGFAPANRVDMDRFGREAAWLGVGGTLAKVNESVRLPLDRPSHPQLESQKRLSGPSRGGNHAQEANAGHAAHMDSTLHAATDTSHHDRPQDEA